MNHAALNDYLNGTLRVEKVELEGRVFWIKRPEQLGIRMRLQKGDPAKAFAIEVAAHQELAARGLPVAPVVMAGPDSLVTEDCGPPVSHLVRADPGNAAALLSSAASALAELHDARVAHGRPNLKDICWDGQRMPFLDFERAGRDSDIGRATEMDVLVFLFSIAAETGGSAEAMTAARDAYRKARPETWKRAQARLRRFLPLRWALWPVTRALSGKREFAAVEPFFRFVLG